MEIAKFNSLGLLYSVDASLKNCGNRRAFAQQGIPPRSGSLGNKPPSEHGSPMHARISRKCQSVTNSVRMQMWQ